MVRRALFDDLTPKDKKVIYEKEVIARERKARSD